MNVLLAVGTVFLLVIFILGVIRISFLIVFEDEEEDYQIIASIFVTVLTLIYIAGITERLP